MLLFKLAEVIKANLIKKKKNNTMQPQTFVAIPFLGSFNLKLLQIGAILKQLCIVSLLSRDFASFSSVPLLKDNYFVRLI